MVLIHAFVLISVETGMQSNYSAVLYLVNERQALSETLQTGIECEWVERNVVLEIVP